MSLFRYLLSINHILEQEYHNLSLWYCVSFIVGLVTYFTLNNEPAILLIISIPTIALPLIIASSDILRCFIFKLIIAFSYGMAVGKYRTYTNNHHISYIFPKTSTTQFEYNDNSHIFQAEECIISPIEGAVNAIKSRNHGVQITLNQVKIYKLLQNPAKVRITVPAEYAKEIDINNTIKIVAKLCKPQSSLLPGSYDFSFYAYFNNLGATGFALGPPEIISRTSPSTNNFIYNIRKNIYTRLIQVLGSLNGNFAAAILLGETKALDKNIMHAMRRGGISHILCVSGLHLSLVATILFITIRFLLNLSNYIAYNYNIKSVAAICSLIGSYSYLELTNMQIAATRAFIMTAIFIYALMIERSICPLRSLAAAAFIILSLNPEVVLSRATYTDPLTGVFRQLI